MSHETKTALFSHNDWGYVWRSKGETFTPKNTEIIVKHGVASATGTFHKMNGTKNQRIDG